MTEPTVDALGDPGRSAVARRILHVEDDPVNRALLRAVIDRCREPDVRAAELVEVEDLRSARSALTAAPVDLILLDVRLPDGNGLDLAREIHSGGPGERPWIIVLSASVLPAERAVALAAGADEFLPKPYDAAMLIAHMARHLGTT